MQATTTDGYTAKMGRACKRHQRPEQNKITVMTEQEMKEIADMVTANMALYNKEVLTFEETALYLGVSKSHLYKLTMKGEIPHFKPRGKMCYFNRLEMEAWLQRNRVATDSEISRKATNYCNSRPMAV